MADTIEEYPKRRIIVSVLVIAAFVLAGFFVVARYSGKSPWPFPAGQKNTDYIIPGVPYIGNYNHKGGYSYLENSTSQIAASVMDYWFPGENDYAKIYSFFSPASSRGSNLIGPESVSNSFIQSGKYSVKTEHLELNELKKYINSDARTPLMTFLAVDSNQPAEIGYHPLTLIIGIRESEQKLILHDAYLGNNYEISFDEFSKRSERMRPSERNSFMVVQPVDLKNKLKEVKKRNFAEYPARTLIMRKAENLFKNYAIGMGSSYGRQSGFAVDYLTKAKNDPDYEEYFPPVFKVYLTAVLTDSYLKKDKKDLDKALASAEESVSLDYDLDKPFKDWPGWETSKNTPDITGQLSYPYRVLGDVYLAKGDFQKAKENFEKTLSISPLDKQAAQKLEAVDAELAKKK